MDELEIQEEIVNIIRKKHFPDEVLTEAEQLLLDQWVAQDPERRTAIVEKGNSLLLRIADARRALRLNEHIMQTQTAAVKRILRETRQDQPASIYIWMRHHWHLAAASLVIVLGACVVLLLKDRNASKSSIASVSEQMDSIETRAVLRLQSGRTIYLEPASNDTLHENGTVISQQGTTVAYTPKDKGERVYNELHTPAASQFTIILPDSTKVILNANSSLRFPNRFEGGIRNVKLDGEAFFVVKRDDRAPFYVVFGESKVQVLGTQFCISAYDVFETVTTLKEGSIKVTHQYHEEILRPGQQSRIKNGSMVIRDADLSKELAWVDGWFFFDGEAIQPIMNSLARWYDVSVEYIGEPVVGRYAGSFKRSMPLEKILSILEENGGVEFEYDKVRRKVTITKPK